MNTIIAWCSGTLLTDHGIFPDAMEQGAFSRTSAGIAVDEACSPRPEGTEKQIHDELLQISHCSNTVAGKPKGEPLQMLSTEVCAFRSSTLAHIWLDNLCVSGQGKDQILMIIDPHWDSVFDVENRYRTLFLQSRKIT